MGGGDERRDREAGDVRRGQAVKVCTWPCAEAWVLSQGSKDSWKSLQAFDQSYRARALTVAAVIKDCAGGGGR